MKILYVDDDENVRANAEAKLRKLGHRVFSAASFEEASELLRDPDNRIQLVIADHKMEANGFSFVLGAQQAYPRLRVCVLSQDISRSDVNQLESAGVTFYRKPVLLEKVVKEVRVPPPVRPNPAPLPGSQTKSGLLATAKTKRKGGLFGMFK